MLKRVSLVLVVLTVFSASLCASSPAKSLQRAQKRGVPVLLLVTSPGAPNPAQARATVKEAAHLIKGCKVVEIDKADKANSALVAKYRLAGAPTPFVLVLAGNGAVAGGLPSRRARLSPSRRPATTSSWR